MIRGGRMVSLPLSLTALFAGIISWFLCMSRPNFQCQVSSFFWRPEWFKFLSVPTQGHKRSSHKSSQDWLPTLFAAEVRESSWNTEVIPGKSLTSNFETKQCPISHCFSAGTDGFQTIGKFEGSELNGMTFLWSCKCISPVFHWQTQITVSLWA